MFHGMGFSSGWRKWYGPRGDGCTAPSVSQEMLGCVYCTMITKQRCEQIHHCSHTTSHPPGRGQQGGRDLSGWCQAAYLLDRTATDNVLTNSLLQTLYFYQVSQSRENQLPMWAVHKHSQTRTWLKFPNVGGQTGQHDSQSLHFCPCHDWC